MGRIGRRDAGEITRAEFLAACDVAVEVDMVGGPLKWHGKLVHTHYNKREQRGVVTTSLFLTSSSFDQKGSVMAARDFIGTLQSLPTVDGREFRSIPGFRGYAAGSDGSIWSCKLTGVWRQLKPNARKEDGRARFTLKADSGKYTRLYGSHFVLFAFVGPRPSGMIACHNNGNCLDDRPSNLRWDTDLENHRDMLRHGTQIGGENHPKTKLSDIQIAEVLELRRIGRTLKSIASVYGVTEARIHQICKKGSR